MNEQTKVAATTGNKQTNPPTTRTGQKVVAAERVSCLIRDTPSGSGVQSCSTSHADARGMRDAIPRGFHDSLNASKPHLHSPFLWFWNKRICMCSCYGIFYIEIMNEQVHHYCIFILYPNLTNLFSVYVWHILVSLWRLWYVRPKKIYKLSFLIIFKIRIGRSVRIILNIFFSTLFIAAGLMLFARNASFRDNI